RPADQHGKRMSLVHRFASANQLTVKSAVAPIVAFRSTKGLSFAERKATMEDATETSLFPNAPQIVQRADKELPVRHRRRRITLFFQRVAAYHLECFAGLEDVGHAGIVRGEQVPRRRHRRRAVMLAQTLHPVPFPRLRIETTGKAAVGDDEEPFPERNR